MFGKEEETTRTQDGHAVALSSAADNFSRVNLFPGATIALLTR